MNARIALMPFALALTLAVPALAHVRVTPSGVRAGSMVRFVFRCPNERANSATTKLVLQLPPEYPMESVTVPPIAGWRSSVTMRPLPAPIETRHGAIRAAVDTITWAGGAIAPGEHRDFAIRAGPIPAAAKQLVFKALQTYSDGEVVRWIELRHAGEPAPPNPAPVVEVR